jgi:hypothetical protein
MDVIRNPALWSTLGSVFVFVACWFSLLGFRARENAEVW